MGTKKKLPIQKKRKRERKRFNAQSTELYTSQHKDDVVDKESISSGKIILGSNSIEQSFCLSSLGGIPTLSLTLGLRGTRICFELGYSLDLMKSF